MKRFLVVVVCASILLSFVMGCAITYETYENASFATHEEKTKKKAESWVGKPFKKYLAENPVIYGHVPDGSGGYMYTVVVKPPMHAKSLKTSDPLTGTFTSNLYGRYIIRLYVNPEGIIDRITFETEII